jgi:hypothetical protein
MWDKVAKLLALSRLRCRGSRWGFHRSQLVYVRGEGALYPVPRAFEEEGCYRRDYSGQELQRLLEFRLFLGLIQYAPPKISGTEGAWLRLGSLPSGPNKLFDLRNDTQTRSERPVLEILMSDP